MAAPRALRFDPSAAVARSSRVMSPRLDSSHLDLGPRPRLGYSASRIDRAAERRTDADAMRALEEDSSARAYVIGGEMIVLRKTEAKPDPLFACAVARGLAGGLAGGAETAFLGLIDGAPRFAVAIDPANATALKDDSAFEVTDLRSIALRGLIEAEHLPPLAEGKALLNWHARH